MMNKRNHSAKVLLIEDSPEDAEMIKDALIDTPMSEDAIKWVEDGQEALDYLFQTAANLETNIVLPKLILLDLKLPKVHGLTVLEKVKSNARLKHIPIVVLTSSQEDVDVREAYERGTNSYIIKPVDFTAFNEAVQQVARYWLMLNNNEIVYYGERKIN